MLDEVRLKSTGGHVQQNRVRRESLARQTWPDSPSRLSGAQGQFKPRIDSAAGKYLLVAVREGLSGAHIGGRNARHMREIPPLVDTKILRPAETALALNLVSEMDLLRLKTVARLYARGLPPDMAWDDLLQEALTRVLVGSRRRPEGVKTVSFLAGIMRSLKAEHWRRALRGSGRPDTLRIDHADIGSGAFDLPDPAPGPERSLSAGQQLAAIERLFADDPLALKIITGLGEGLSAEQIRSAIGVSKTNYDSARRRMRRVLLREGLTCEPR